MGEHKLSEYVKKSGVELNIKVTPHVYVKNPKVLLKDVASIECVDQDMAEKIKQIHLHEFSEKIGKNNQLEFFTVLKLIELIHQEFPTLSINNIGPTDFIIERTKKDMNPTKLKGWDMVKLWGLCVAIFFGSAFTIMAFHNDIGLTEVFEKYYMQIMGRSKPQFSELELSYTIGIATGILIFFNHLGKKKFSQDPTPIQVEMIKFKQDMDTTLLENATKKGHTQDVS